MVSLWESKKKNLKSKYQPFTELLTHPSKTQEGYENKNQQPFHLDEFSKEKYLRKKGGVMSLNAEVTEQAIFPTALKRCSSPKHSTEPCNQHTARHMSTSDKGLTLVMLLTLESIPKPQSVIIIYRFWVLVAHPHFCQHPTGSETPCGRFPGASQWALARTSARARPGCSREGRPALFAAPPAGGPLPGERNSREWFAYTFKELSREKWKLNSQTCSHKIWFKKEEEGLLWAFGVDADHI